MSAQIDLYVEKDSLHKNDRDNRCRFQFTMGDTFAPANLHKIHTIKLNGAPIEIEVSSEFCKLYFIHKRCLRFEENCSFAKNLPLNSFCHCPKAGTSRARVADSGYHAAAKHRAESAWNNRMNKKMRSATYEF